jgi:hypothetical protein
MGTRRLLSAAGLCLLCFCVEASAQGVISIARPTGRVGLGFDGSWVAVNSLAPQSTQMMREWVQLNLSGAVVHPRVFNFTLGLQPLWQQTRWTGPPASERGGLSGLYWNGAATLLSGAPVSLSLTTFNNRIDSRDRLGSEFQGDNGGWEARLSYPNFYLPVSVSYQGRSRDLFWRYGPDRVTRQADRVRSLRLSAQNSKTRVLLERLVYDNRIAPFDYDHYRADAFHNFSWGKGSRIQSGFRYLNRNGASAYDRTSWQQQFRIQHTWTVWSELFYQLLSEVRPGSFARRKVGELRLNYKPRLNLAFSGELRAESRNFSIAQQSFYRFRPRADFAGVLPFGASFNAFLSPGLEWVNQEPTAGGSVAVEDEVHIVGPSARFVLDELNAELGSIRITSPDETTLYEPDLDYQILDSRPFTEILVLPTGRIAPGDTLHVDYRYQLGPAGSGQNVFAEFGLSVRWGNLTVYHDQAIRRSTEGSAAAGFALLPTGDRINTGVSYLWRPSFGSMIVSAEQRRRTAANFDQTYYVIGSTLGFFISERVTGRVGASATLQRSRATANLNIYTANGNVDWNPTPYLLLRARLAAWRSSQQFFQQSYLGGGVEADWRLAQLRLTLRYDLITWNESSDRIENRLLVGLSRGF